MSQNQRRTRGFTIVELLIVVVVIAILAAITAVAYNGVQDRVRVTTLQSDLSNASKALELARIEDPLDSYPTTLPSNVKVSANVGLSLSTAPDSYCINAQTLSGATLRYYRTPNGFQEGTCPGGVIPRSEVGMPANQINDTGFTNLTTSGWYLARGSSGNIIGTTRAGVPTDPFPNRRVLQINNTPSGVSGWFFFAGPVNFTGIQAGKSYTTRYWVRLASGNFSGTADHFGVQHGGATNPAFSPTTTTMPITSTWREVTRSTIAVANGTSGNVLYLTINGAASSIQNNTFTLEYQGFELYEN